MTQSHWHPQRQLAGVGSPGLGGCALAPAPVSWRSGVLARRAEDPSSRNCERRGWALGRGQGEGGGSGGEERGYGSSSDTWERCPQGFCASRVKRPPLSLRRVVHPNPGDRPTTPFLEACRLIPARHQCKHLQYAHRRAAAVCPKTSLRGTSSMARKGSFSLSFWGHRTGTVELLKSLSIGTRPETAAAATACYQGTLTMQRQTADMPANSCSRGVRKVWPWHGVS